MRLLVRLITTLLGIVVAIAGALLAIETAWAWMRPGDGLIVPPSVIRAPMEQLSWSSLPVLIAAGVVALLGLIMVLIAARAGRNDIRLHDPAPEVTVITDPRSLARLVGHRVREQDGVAAASVTATRKRVRVRATSQFSYVGDLRSRLTTTTDESVHDLPLRTTPTASVSVSPAKEAK